MNHLQMNAKPAVRNWTAQYELEASNLSHYATIVLLPGRFHQVVNH